MRKDFLTPPDEGSGVTCRTLRTPSEKEWLGVFNSALLTLLDTWRWEQVNDTDLTPDEAVAICRQVLDDFWSSSLCGCSTPEGTPIIRINPDGFFEELIDDEWLPPEGEYALPPVTPRESGTEEDKRCLAAKNAAQVLQQLYEEVADSFTAHLTYAEAIDQFIIFIAGLVAVALSIVIAAALVFAALVFKAFYETIEFVSSDYWTTDFNDKLACVLIECSEVAGDVVTFNFDCVTQRLANKTDISTDPFDLLLFGQVYYLLQIIGADGLNLAGATIEITDADCSFCNDHCFYLDFRVTDGISAGWHASGGTYTSGTGYEGTYIDPSNVRDVYGYFAFPETLLVSRIEMVYYKGGGSGGNDVNRMNTLYPTATGYSTVLLAQDATNIKDTDEYLMKVMEPLTDLAGVGCDINTGDTTDGVILQSWKIFYNGDIPEEWEDNC